MDTQVNKTKATIVPDAKDSTNEVIADEIEPQQLPKMIELGSTTCIPCKKMKPILEELTSELKGKLVIDFIDVNVDKSAGQRFNINFIPTQIFFAPSGEEIYRHVGFFDKQAILDKWAELGYTFK